MSEPIGPIALWQVVYEECRLLHPEFPTDPTLEEKLLARGDADGGRKDPPPRPNEAEEERLLKVVIGHIHAACPDRAALCLSGGGIRSATFSLGVLQGLAVHGLLERFTYLSTVSGGGYIGSWLSAWTHRANQATVRQGLVDSVVRRDNEPPPVEMLRAYSNYLTPSLGLLSADTWTIVATVLRNLLLNWLVLVPVVAIVLLLPLLLREFVLLPSGPWAAVLLLVLGSGLLLMPIAYVDGDLPSSANRRWPQRRFLTFSLAPLVASAALLAVFWAIYVAAGNAASLVTLLVFGVSVHVAGWLAGRIVFRKGGPSGAAQRRPPTPLEVAAIVIVGALGGLALWLVVPERVDTTNLNAYLVLAVPVQLGLFLLATTVYVGLASRWTTDEDREWWARAGGWVLVAALGWLAVTSVGLLGPWLVAYLWDKGGRELDAFVATTGVTGIVTWIAGRSARTPSGVDSGETGSKQGTALQWALTIAAPLFVVALALLIASGATVLFERFNDVVAGIVPIRTVLALLVFLVLLAALAGVASWTVNVNRFSLHAMYRNRLIRAYLGAPRYGGTGKKRDPSPFTGFDENDNVRMHELVGKRPFHVVNIALNLVRGRRLAWQHRKAAAFSVSPLHCGTAAPGKDGLAIGYQRAHDYGGGRSKGVVEGISLGTAMAISGAAVSPNMGYHSSPIVALVLTAFNGRLGWWLANPGAAGRGRWGLDGPRWALRPLFAEALGLTDEDNPYVYLSDGGHFENLGLYEMVRRRCRTIVVVDGGCDGKEHFEDLGNALRKIRIDLGIEIDWVKGTPGTLAGQRCYSATILYSRADGVSPDKDGQLIVLKPAVADADPVDVGTYKRLHCDFPHQSTGDQWFDEEQFESYRRLGLVTCDLAASVIASALPPPSP